MNASQDPSSSPAETGATTPRSSTGTGHLLVIHTRARLWLSWLLPALARFPREHRHTTARHMADLAMQVHDRLIEARHHPGPARAEALRQADIALDQLRQYALLVCEWHWWSEGQFAHFSRLTEELGRLLGGWRRSSGHEPPGGGRR